MITPEIIDALAIFGTVLFIIGVFGAIEEED